jgi:hypothetical protein
MRSYDTVNSYYDNCGVTRPQNEGLKIWPINLYVIVESKGQFRYYNQRSKRIKGSTFPFIQAIYREDIDSNKPVDLDCTVHWLLSVHNFQFVYNLFPSRHICETPPQCSAPSLYKQ